VEATAPQDEAPPLPRLGPAGESATDRATLLFLFRDAPAAGDPGQPLPAEATSAVPRREELLLIVKKRGLGAGKVNGPGGRLEPGESPAEAAVRECREEVCVEVAPAELRLAGQLSFLFTNGYSLFCTVFTALRFQGTPTETDEAIPFFAPTTELPYERMWKDDALWLPLLLAGTPFQGRFVFDGDHMLRSEVLTPSQEATAMSKSPRPDEQPAPSAPGTR